MNSERFSSRVSINEEIARASERGSSEPFSRHPFGSLHDQLTHARITLFLSSLHRTPTLHLLFFSNFFFLFSFFALQRLLSAKRDLTDEGESANLYKRYKLAGSESKKVYLSIPALFFLGKH